MKNFLHYLTGIGLLGITLASVQPLHIDSLTVKKPPVPFSIQITQKAKQWGLSIRDYQHYQQLMKQAPNQRWYAQLDPAEVLGLNSDNSTDRLRYATIQAKQMHQRVQRELAFNEAYIQVYRTLYPNEQAIQSPWRHDTISTTLKKGDRLWWFVDGRDPAPTALMQSLLAITKKSGAILDIYVVDPSITPMRLQQWAIASHLPNTLIHREITLNIGNTRWAMIRPHHTATLPFVARLHNHHLQLIDWKSFKKT